MRGRPDPSVDIAADGPAECPYCGSEDTTREHPKGPSLCRSIHHCNACRESFEAMN
jgi:transposase-like protein